MIGGDEPQSHPPVLSLPDSQRSASVDMGVPAFPDPVVRHGGKKLRQLLAAVGRRVMEEEQLFPRLGGRLQGTADPPLLPSDNKRVVLLVPLKEPPPASAEEHPLGFHRVIMEYLQGG